MTETETILLVTDDEVVSKKLIAAASALGRSLVSFRSVAEASDFPEPAAVVIDLGIDDATGAAARLRGGWPRALIAGFVSVPDREVWERALEAGYNLVATRGTIAAKLRDALPAWHGPPSARRIRLFDAADVVGRLGVLARLRDTPVGPVAVYRIGRGLHVAGDRCPHAGATLSEGEFEEGIITCPRHGSRFDVRSGERVRGPADAEIPVYRVVEEAGVVWIELDET